MKYTLKVLADFFALFFFMALFSVAALAKPVLHKTESGTYPAYFEDTKEIGEWDDEKQTEFDSQMDDMIQTYCQGTQRIANAEASIKAEKESGKISGYVDMKGLRDSGAWIVQLKPQVEHAKKKILELTHKPASDYECEE